MFTTTRALIRTHRRTTTTCTRARPSRDFRANDSHRSGRGREKREYARGTWKIHAAWVVCGEHVGVRGAGERVHGFCTTWGLWGPPRLRTHMDRSSLYVWMGVYSGLYAILVGLLGGRCRGCLEARCYVNVTRGCLEMWMFVLMFTRLGQGRE